MTYRNSCDICDNDYSHSPGCRGRGPNDPMPIRGREIVRAAESQNDSLLHSYDDRDALPDGSRDTWWNRRRLRRQSQVADTEESAA